MKRNDLDSERLARTQSLVQKALFDGDANAAAAWLCRPTKALDNKSPLELARTELGARAVEDLIGRLEFGVDS